MGVTEIFRIEMGAIGSGLVLLLGGGMVTGKISLRGLFRSGSSGEVSAERVLLFVTMLIVSSVFIVRMVQVRAVAMPALGTGWLLLFGASCIVYLGMKAFRTFSGKSR